MTKSLFDISTLKVLNRSKVILKLRYIKNIFLNTSILHIRPNYPQLCQAHLGGPVFFNRPVHTLSQLLIVTAMGAGPAYHLTVQSHLTFIIYPLTTNGTGYSANRFPRSVIIRDFNHHFLNNESLF